MGWLNGGDEADTNFSNAVTWLTVAYNNAIRSAAGTWQISQIRIQAADQIKATADDVKAANKSADDLVASPPLDVIPQSSGSRGNDMSDLKISRRRVPHSQPSS